MILQGLSTVELQQTILTCVRNIPWTVSSFFSSSLSAEKIDDWSDSESRPLYSSASVGECTRIRGGGGGGASSAGSNGCLGIVGGGEVETWGGNGKLRV